MKLTEEQRELIEKRIAELVEARRRFVEEANRGVAELGGRIAELTDWLESGKSETDTERG